MRRLRPRRPAKIAALLLASALGTGSTRAHAQSASTASTADDARTRFEAARALFDRGNYDAALVEFERVYELMQGNPRRYVVQFNIAQCHERMFRYDEALRAYQHYLDEGGPTADDRIAIEATMRALDGLLGTLTVRINVPHGEVWVDDRHVGDAPGSVRVPGGRHVVQIRAPGFAPAQQEVQLPARATREVAFTLEALRVRHGISPVWFGSASAVAGVALLTGAGFGTAALVMHNNDVAATAPTNPNRFDIGPADQQAIRNTALTADILFGTGVLFAAGAVVFLVMTDWHHGRAESPHARRGPAILPMPSLDPSTPGFSLAWSM